MSKNTTKRALLTSVFALALCLVMLIGTTFAWFTDTASTGINKIQSGTLKMKVEYSTDTVNWKDVDANTPIFDENALWEPGRTEIVYVRVTNIGKLALRYDFDISVNSYSPGINATGKAFNVGDYLMFGSADTEQAYETRENAVSAVAANERILGTIGVSVAKQSVLKAGEVSAVKALVLYMPTTVGNEANNVDKSRTPNVELGVKFNATQATVEKDSFGPDYDAKAPTIFSPVEYNRGTHTLTENVYADGKWGAVAVNGGTTTIEADVHATARNNTAVAVWAGGGWNGKANVIINSGSFTQDKPGDDTHYDFIYASNGGRIIINGGTFKAATPQWTLNCKDGSGSTITVKGGTFYQFDSSHANVGAGEVIVPDGYSVIQNGDWYTVVKGTPVTDAAELTAALQSEENIVLANDITITTGVKTAKNKKQTLDFNGHKLILGGEDQWTYGYLDAYGELTLVDSVGNGGITGKFYHSPTKVPTAIFINDGAVVNLESGTIENVYRGVANYYSGGTFNMTGGKIAVKRASEIESAGVLFRRGGTVNLTGGEISGAVYFENTATTQPSYTIGDGFTNTNNSVFHTSGVTAKQNADGIWMSTIV